LLNLPPRYDLDGLLNEHGVLLEYSTTMSSAKA
jgi:hypothetical protein